MNLTEAYTEIWRGKLPGTRPPSEQHIDRVVWTTTLFPDLKNTLLVDLGAGSGQMLWEAKKRGWKAIGYEYDKGVCEWLTAGGYQVSWADLSEDNLLIENVDIVTCCDVIEHLLDPLHAMREAYRILKPGGLCYVSTPNVSCWRRIKSLMDGVHPRTSGDDVLLDGGHIGYYGPHDLTRILSKAGFTKVDLRYFNPDPIPPELAHLDKLWHGFTYMIAVAVK